jgi:hypothetical protein
MKTKTFDCVRMKDEVQQRRVRELAGLSRSELLAHYASIHAELVRWQEAVRDARRSTTAATPKSEVS